MPVLVTIDYQHIPVADYDSMQPGMAPEFLAASGFIAHIAITKGGRLSAMELWRSREDFETWMTETIIPALERAGGSEPDYTVEEVHNLLLAGEA
jgi:hypothetical protein